MLSQVYESNEMIANLNQKVEQAATTDPYEKLGVSPRAIYSDLKKADRDFCARHHPDKLASLALAAEYIDLTNSQKIVRIIDAYQRIKKQRSAETAARAEAEDLEPVFNAL